MLVVELNRANFEYDVNSIVRAFYPEEQVYVLTPDCREEKREQLGGNVRIRVELGEEGALLSVDGREYGWEWRGDSQESPEPAGDAAGDEETAGKTDEKTYKYGFKCFLYRALCQETGKELPWGNLTGIRPTKIAYQLLEQGVCEQEIIDYYMLRYYVSRDKAKLSVDIARRERELLGGLCVQDDYSLYIGIPFCPSTCLYCSFTSFAIAAYREKVDGYIDCLIKEMEFVAQRYRDRRLDCVYIGGGTPTPPGGGQLWRAV